MQTDTVDQYAPRKTGVYNVVLREWGGMSCTEANQQWTYHAENQSLQSRGGIGGVLFEGFNKNLITFKFLKMKNQMFKYDHEKKRWWNTATGNAVDIHKDQIKADTNIVTEPPDATAG